MEDRNIYQDIAERTQGDIYNRRGGACAHRQINLYQAVYGYAGATQHHGRLSARAATDELPQSAAGRTIMTTEPKFIPEDAVEIALAGSWRILRCA